MTRRTSIEPQRSGRRDKRLEAAQVLQIARFAQRASLEEVAGSIAVEQTATEIDAFFAELPARRLHLPTSFLPSYMLRCRLAGRTRPRRSGALTRATGLLPALDRQPDGTKSIECEARSTRHASGCPRLIGTGAAAIVYYVNHSWHDADKIDDGFDTRHPHDEPAA